MDENIDITLQRILSLIPRKPNGKFVHGSQKEFAEKLNMPHNLVTMWVSGSSKSYMQKLYEISDKYNVSVEWLKGETDVKEKPAPKNGDEFWELYMKLDPKKKQLIQNMIEQLSGEK